MPNVGFDMAGSGIEGLSIAPTRRSATATGSGVDFSEGEGPVNAIFQIGNLSNSGGLTLALALQESSNDNTADASGAADAYAALSDSAGVSATQADENSVIVVTSFARAERYVRAVVTHTGTALQNIYGVSLHMKSKSY